MYKALDVDFPEKGVFGQLVPSAEWKQKLEEIIIDLL